MNTLNGRGIIAGLYSPTDWLFSVHSVPLWQTAIGLSRAAESYAATVALVVSLQGPVAPLVLTHRER